MANVPLDVEIDFAKIVAAENWKGVVDPNSIEVFDTTSHAPVASARTEDFAYSDRGHLQWVIENPERRDYEIRFNTVRERPPLLPQEHTPLIGVGDLLRYNAGEPRPIAPIYLSGLLDLNGDGLRDLIGCWNYAYRPGWPWDGVIAFPGLANAGPLEFGDLSRLRWAAAAENDGPPNHFTGTYMHAAVGDLNGDDLPDLVFSPSGSKTLQFYLNRGRREPTGFPIFEAAGSVERPSSGWNPCRAVDLNRDGAVDLVVSGAYARNTNADGWPIRLAPPVDLDVGREACFADLDGDGQLDAICLVDGPATDTRAASVAWQRNLGGDPPRFGPKQPLQGIDRTWCTSLAAVRDDHHVGLLVGYGMGQHVEYYQQEPLTTDQPRFRRVGTPRSKSAVLALSDQAWPCVCDWNGDHVWDLLVGGGYGWPRIVLNRGTNRRPQFSLAQRIEDEQGPIRILRDEVLGGKHWHNMGYPLPVFVDWDSDGLADLMLPNETNRIFWYKNEGSHQRPRFGRRRQVICDGYPDSDEMRALSARRSSDPDEPNQPYPYEAERPFFWRTGACFADFTDDGLIDLVTHDGHTRKATLFVRYRDDQQQLRLRKGPPLRLADGREIDDSIVGRTSHWTESFRSTDWDGDGRIDLIYSCAGTRAADGSIYLLRNVGTRSEPVFANPRTLCCYGEPIKVTAHGPHPWVADMDDDGRPDLLTCVEWSVYPFYRHAAIEMSQKPAFELRTVAD